MVMHCMVNGHDGDALFDHDGRVLYGHDGHPFSLRLMTGQAKGAQMACNNNSTHCRSWLASCARRFHRN